jgi:hypothetical protein
MLFQNSAKEAFKLFFCVIIVLMEQIIRIIPASQINLRNPERKHCPSFITFST